MLNKKGVINMTNEIKYYKAEANGVIAVRQSKRDYNIAMAIDWDNGKTLIESFNSRLKSKGAVLRYWCHARNNCVEQMEVFNTTKVYPVPLTLISKEEYKEIKAIQRAEESAYYAARAAQRSA
tara:strand:- start:128 stop:496 length:369 start_codon:yes stop_codon:yes gene_type:complete